MNKGTKWAVIAIGTALAVIAALVAAILLIRAKSEPDGIGKLPEDALTAAQSAETEDVPADFDPEAIAATIVMDTESGSERPSGWYGRFESAGPASDGTGLEDAKKACPDVYAWIRIQGTDIDYPIAYCEDAVEPFYFTHDINGEPSENGMIITDSQNGKDFSDPLTLIYGHCPDDGTMFAPLHSFRDADFFATHENVSIRVDDAELVYRIYACFVGSNENMMLANDFRDPVSFMEYFESMSKMRDLSANIRKDAEPSFDDHVIALITHCEDESKRLFVYAVLEEVKY
ncbi:MAG: class B sortase [Lachnospiraceae bacterium]|nr:class B sortase [Lachnospiraceae bacterium]